MGALSLSEFGCLPANQANTAAIKPTSGSSSTTSAKKSLAEALGGNSSSTSSSVASDGALGQCLSYVEGSSDRTVCRSCYTEIINSKCSGKTYATCPDPVAKLNFTNLVNTCVQNSLAAGFICTKTCSSGLTLNASTCNCQVPTTTIGNAGDSLIDVGAENFGPPVASLFIPNGYAIKVANSISDSRFSMNPLHFIVKNRGDTIRSGNTFSAEFQSCKYVDTYVAASESVTWSSGVTPTSTLGTSIISAITAPSASTTYGDVYDGTFLVNSSGLNYYTAGIMNASFRGATYLFDKPFVTGPGGTMFEWPLGLPILGANDLSRQKNAILGNFLGNFNQDGGDDDSTIDDNVQFTPTLSDGVTQAILKRGLYHMSFKLILLDDWEGEDTEDAFNVEYTLTTAAPPAIGAWPAVLLGSGTLGSRTPYTFTTDPSNYSQTFPGSPLWNGLSGHLTGAIVSDSPQAGRLIAKDAVYQIDLDVPIEADAGITFDFYNDTLASPKKREARSWGIKDFKFYLKSAYHPQCGIKYTFTDSNQQESQYCFRFLPRTNCDGSTCLSYADPITGGAEGSFFFPIDNQQSCP